MTERRDRPGPVTPALADAIAHVAATCDLANADVDAPIQHELGLDSMEFLELVAAIEAATGVAIPERAYPEVSTLRALDAYVVSGGASS